MIPVTSLKGRHVAVFGLGESGRATAKALAAGGATVAAWDDNADAIAAARAAGIAVADLGAADWSRFAALILAPGVPLTHPEPHWSVRRARAAGIEVIGDIELFCRERRRHQPDAAFIAVTGTNGKSTTTALIAHLLSAAGRDVALGGNIGTAILALEPAKRGGTHVVECSSFQIDLAPSLDPSHGVLLNITADHLDRHGTIEAYARIKERLVTQSAMAVIAVDDPWCQAIADRVQRSRPVIRVSARQALANGLCAEAGGAVFAVAERAAVKVADLAGISSLRGAHNAENAVAAIAVARALGLGEAAIAQGLATFPGLSHRMEEVGRRGRVLFVNDSKATNADAAAKALACFSRIYWIAGGRPKAGGIASLTEFFPRIAKAYLIGEAAGDFARTLGDVPYAISGTLAAAVARAAADAAADPADEPVVLLSPACASYDQFQNFERRGDAFRALVRQLNGISSRGEAA
jgi:UDP-N-acetylmuramoylalanine--D-glutamate ligase